MIAAKLLCEFVTNPFGNEGKARELLSEIEGRELSDAELERGQFSFQIALYFVALLAIESSIADASVRRTFLGQMHERIRAFYARAASPVLVRELMVSPRDCIGGGPATMTTTRLALFDLVGWRRLFEYRDALKGANPGDGFYILAQRVLLHYSGCRQHPVVVATIAELLLANYNIACQIVNSGLAAIESRQLESEDSPQPLLLGPGMPDLTDRQPVKAYAAGPYLLQLFEDVAPIGRKSRLRFKYVLALCDKRDRLPLCFVTLENSSSIANVLCVFERNGSHSNYGLLQGYNLAQEFIGKGVVLLGDRFALGELAELRKASPAAPAVNAAHAHYAA
jgi:hypothetical protein